ncbi:MAG: YolD-like family protein [Ruminococcaceae bacterium]|nr:YolD-like family protein [Oscillospiraceae bacterium]
MDSYQDIIHLQRPVSSRHAPMSMEDRAAQFAPFAALTGYDGVIAETGRLTETWGELAEGALEELDEALHAVEAVLDTQPQVTVTRFCPDGRKAGGAYVTSTGRVKKMDPYERVLVFTDGTKIPMDGIVAVRMENAK